MDEQKVVENTIFQQDHQHFGKAQCTPFTVSPLNHQIDFGANTETSKYILKGEFNDEAPTDITCLVLRQPKASTRVPLSATLSMLEFVDKLKYWRDSKCTNPAGHLGHYLALVKPHGIHDTEKADTFETLLTDILDIHLTILQYCLKFGYSLLIWQYSITMMIEKDVGKPKLHRLQVIHIYEKDYNLLLGVKHRTLIHHMHDINLFQDGVFSNHLGFSALDPVFLEERQHEYCQLTCYSQIKTGVDAVLCYDRIVPWVGSLNLQKI